MSFYAITLAQKPFEIKGKVEGMKSDTVTLFRIIDKEPQVWLKTTMVNGEFTFKGTTDMPELCRIQLGSYKFPIRDLFVDAGTLRYTNSFDTKVGRPAVPKIEGTPAQDDLNAYNTESGKFNKEMRNLNSLLYTEKDKLSSEEKAKINHKIDSLDYAQTAYRNSAIKTYSNSIVGAYIIHSSFLNGGNVTNTKRYTAALSPEILKTRIAKEITTYIAKMEKVDIGAAIPTFVMKDINGKDFDIASMKGKVYVIDFWASWCGPCRKENPNMVKLYNELHPKGMEMIGISLDKEYDKWKVAIEKDGLTWTHISDLQYWDNKAAKLFMIAAVPTTIVVDRNGKIAARGLHGEALRQAVEKQLAK